MIIDIFNFLSTKSTGRQTLVEQCVIGATTIGQSDSFGYREEERIVTSRVVVYNYPLIFVRIVVAVAVVGPLK